jgi:hypothetical protein
VNSILFQKRVNSIEGITDGEVQADIRKTFTSKKTKNATHLARDVHAAPERGVVRKWMVND